MEVLEYQKVEAAGLRQLPGVYLAGIDRHDQVIPAVSPAQTLRDGGRLVFVVDVENVVELKDIRGLRVAERQVFKLDTEHARRGLVEAVVSPRFPYLGKTVRQSRFRNHYGAAIIAIARDGEELKAKIGDVVLKPGDTLLLEAPESSEQQQRYSKGFLLVSAVANSRPMRIRKRGWQ